eukprot:scaffold2893_cov254-Pinguiococcus_pyrenoidosus.AAC.23
MRSRVRAACWIGPANDERTSWTYMDPEHPCIAHKLQVDALQLLLQLWLGIRIANLRKLIGLHEAEVEERAENVSLPRRNRTRPAAKRPSGKRAQPLTSHCLRTACRPSACPHGQPQTEAVIWRRIRMVTREARGVRREARGVRREA